MPDSEWFAPSTLDEALAILAREGDQVTVLAGGTGVMPLVHKGLLSPTRVLSLANLDLGSVSEHEGGLLVGATAPLQRLAEMPLVQERAPIIAQAVSAMAAWAIRNAATPGGNLLMGWPSGDLAVPLMALGARVHLQSRQGQRTVPVSDFYDNGTFTSARQPGELITAIEIPAPAGRSAYTRFGARAAFAPTIVSVAAWVHLDAAGRCTAARVALGGVQYFAVRSPEAEAALVGSALGDGAVQAAARAAADALDPADDLLGSAWYRRKLAATLISRTLRAAA